MEMTYDEALRFHESQWNGTGPYDFPYNILYRNDMFVTTTVNYSNCRLQNTDEEKVSKDLELYQEGKYLGPSWILTGKRLKTGVIVPFWDLKFYVVDGNHRMEAQHRNNMNVINVMLPRSNLDMIREQTS